MPPASRPIVRARLRAGTLGLTLLAAAPLPAAADAPTTCRAPLERWTEVDLYLGRKIGRAGLVGEVAFSRFLAEEVTPRFPDGLTVLDATGQFRGAGGRVEREPTKLLVILVPDAASVARKVDEVAAAYKRRFRQESVLRAETAVCLAFQ